ncbi:N-acetyl sugar amidotransferase [Candidatus Pelagibacter sp.]|nr:N-acetyl sugar amidotransferase [Candidatus Pelagibacter sp.]
MLKIKKNIKKIYNTPNIVKFCKNCVTSNQRPRISFNKDGICNACINIKNKIKINWKDREKELKELLSKYRKNNGKFDVIVPSSGGKDSAVVAHKLKYKYNMNPLTVTWAPHVYTDIGWKNFQALIHSGLSNILGTPNGLVHRRLTRESLIEIGDPFQPFIYGQVSFPVKMALQFDVKLIMDGENGEYEYGGDKKASEKSFSPKDEIKFWFSNFEAKKWLKKGFTKKDMDIYISPPIDEIVSKKINRQFWSYFNFWDPQEHYYYSTKNTGFKANPDGRSEGTYSKYASLDDAIDGFHFYFMFLKFGIGRATSDAAHEIRDNHLTRDEAVRLVKKYDGEFPKKHYKKFLDYCNLTEIEFQQICDSWRAKHLWTNKNKKWQLVKQVS